MSARTTISGLRGRGIAAALIAIGLSLAAVTAHAQSVPYQATITGGNVVPAVTTSASGTFTMAVEGITATYTLKVASIENATAAHIHLGAAGENGGVVAVLFNPTGPVNSIDTSGTIAALLGPLADDIVGFGTALAEGRLYVQVHTEDNPPGELRGQIGPLITVADTGSAGIANAGSDSSAPLLGLVAFASVLLVLGGRRLTARTRRVEGAGSN